MGRAGHITGCRRLLLHESRAHQAAHALALAPSKLPLSVSLHSARPALCARSPTRLVRSRRQGSIKRPCRAACTQLPISTRANNNNSRPKARACRGSHPHCIYMQQRKQKDTPSGNQRSCPAAPPGYNFAYFRDMKERRAPTCRARPIAMRVAVWTQ